MGPLMSRRNRRVIIPYMKRAALPRVRAKSFMRPGRRFSICRTSGGGRNAGGSGMQETVILLFVIQRLGEPMPRAPPYEAAPTDCGYGHSYSTESRNQSRQAEVTDRAPAKKAVPFWIPEAAKRQIALTLDEDTDEYRRS